MTRKSSVETRGKRKKDTFPDTKPRSDAGFITYIHTPSIRASYSEKTEHASIVSEIGSRSRMQRLANNVPLATGTPLHAIL